MATYPKFELYSDTIQIANKDLDLHDIKINSQRNVLQEVIVTRRLPITLKGDTIEYDAASFATEKNAKLEDLLRRLPGFTVTGDGSITAQGKSVQKVFIDGEEFFGYDPKIAIRNVRADAVDKVQLYEKKSEEAELSGIDDGVRIQTVNVVLKEKARVSLETWKHWLDQKNCMREISLRRNLIRLSGLASPRVTTTWAVQVVVKVLYG